VLGEGVMIHELRSEAWNDESAVQKQHTRVRQF
jgi:hypothetical protein